MILVKIDYSIVKLQKIRKILASTCSWFVSPPIFSWNPNSSCQDIIFWVWSKNNLWFIAEDFGEYTGLLVPMPDGKVACLQCGKRLSNLNNGRRHFASAHQLNQPAKCNVCNHIFKNSQTRDSHLRQKHGLSPAMIKNAVKMPMTPQS